ncbi:hypothetical protein D3C85_1578600 [compost metagenome]
MWQGAHDTRVDEHQIEHLALQALLQAIELGRVVHFQLFDAHAWHIRQGAGLLRVAHGGGNVPAVFVQALHQAQAQPARGADDKCGFCVSHVDALRDRLARKGIEDNAPGPLCGPSRHKAALTGVCDPL